MKDLGRGTFDEIYIFDFFTTLNFIYSQKQHQNEKTTYSFNILVAYYILRQSEGQKIKVIEGNIDAIKSETNLSFEFTYDSMKVGKYDKEADYVANKTQEYNKKEAGKGDTWAKAWVEDREYRFEPKFKELFTEYSEKTESKKAKYTLILKTIFTEPGYNVGISRKNAKIDAIVLIVETANRSNSAKLSLERHGKNLEVVITIRRKNYEG